MDKKLLNQFEDWFSKYRKEKKRNWYHEICDPLFLQESKNLEKLLKETERNIDKKIDKEISSKNKDRATVNKSIRLSKSPDNIPMYVELRFKDMWEEATETILEPFVLSAVQKIIQAQSDFDEKIKAQEEKEAKAKAKAEEGLGDLKNDPRYRD